jgi:hypothetical protein
MSEVENQEKQWKVGSQQLLASAKDLKDFMKKFSENAHVLSWFAPISLS